MSSRQLYAGCLRRVFDLAADNRLNDQTAGHRDTKDVGEEDCDDARLGQFRKNNKFGEPDGIRPMIRANKTCMTDLPEAAAAVMGRPWNTSS